MTPPLEAIEEDSGVLALVQHLVISVPAISPYGTATKEPEGAHIVGELVAKCTQLESIRVHGVTGDAYVLRGLPSAPSCLTTLAVPLA